MESSNITISEIYYSKENSKKFKNTKIWSEGNKDMKPVSTNDIINDVHSVSEYFIAMKNDNWSSLREDQQIVFNAFCDYLKTITIDTLSNSRYYRVFMIEYNGLYYYIRFRACGGNLYLYVGGIFRVVLGW